MRALRRHFQIIFQDPYASLNPRMLVGEILEEGMRAQGIGTGRLGRQTRVAELLQQVGLPADARASATRMNFPVANASASALPGRWPLSRN